MTSKNYVTLFRGFPVANSHVWSPFVIKLEARLRFAGLPYTTDSGNPRFSPRGKIPYVTIDGETISDSSLIIQGLIGNGTIPDLNSGLSAEQRVQDLGLRALLEDKLCYYQGWERWTQNYYTMRDHVLAPVPYPIRVLVGLLIHRNTVKMLHGQGTGRLTAEEIAAFRGEIWQTINGLLMEKKKESRKTRPTDQPFWVLGGEEPTEADATLFGFIVSVLSCDAGPDSRRVVRGYPVMLEYASNIHDRYFPDYEKWMQ